MAAPVTCPRCHAPWTPDPRHASGSPVCPSCRRVETAVSTTPRPRAISVPPLPPVVAPAAPSRPALLWPVVVGAVALALFAVVGLTLIAVLAPTDTPLPAPAVVDVGVRASDTANLTASPAPPPTAKAGFTPAPPSPPPVVLAPRPEQLAVVPKEIVDRPAAPPAAVAKLDPRAAPVKEPFKRRLPPPSADELIRQLFLAVEIDLERVPGSTAQVVAFAAASHGKLPHPLPQTLTRRKDLDGLPLRMGMDCHLGKESAESLQILSRKLRTYLGESSPATATGAAALVFRSSGTTDPRPNANFVRKKLENDTDGVASEWTKPEAVPTLVQLLQAEDRPMRLLLVEMLDKIPCREATIALALRAAFDLSPDVREYAVDALRFRSAADYQPILLAALRYPWAPPAEFAAEALVNLRDTTAVPALVGMLDDPPCTEGKVDFGKGEVHVTREVVRVNHLRNCLLCHAPSMETTELVRGRVPTPGQPIPPMFSQQYYESNSPGQFVRADITYLKQDFAVPQMVASPGAWPAYQRYDYMVRTKLATDVKKETAKPVTDYPQRQSVLFALRELTGRDAGEDSEAWRTEMRKSQGDAGRRTGGQ